MAKLNLHKDNGCENLIIFIHGFTGSDRTFKNCDNKYIYEYFSDDILKVSDIAFFTYASRVIDLSTVRNLLNLLPLVNIDTRKSHGINKYAQVLKTLCDLQFKKYKTINFICHSMGGIIAKKYIIDNFNCTKKFNGFYITIGTPHKGTNLAIISKLVKNKQAFDLLPLSDFLIDLEDKWCCYKPEKVKYYCGIDDDVVPESSGCPRSEEVNKITINGGHKEMPKPLSIEDLIIQSLNNEISIFLELKRKTEIAISVEDILFLNYRKNCEPYYVIRDSDGLLARTLETKNIWCHGISGTGKTATIQRHAIINDYNYCFIDLSPTPKEADISLIIRDIYHSLHQLLSRKHFFNKNKHSVSDNHINNIVDLISCIDGIDRFYIIIDELSVGDNFDIDSFIENIFVITNAIGNSVNNNTTLKIIISTLFNPKLNISNINNDKFESLFNCFEIKAWDDADLILLIDKISFSLNLNINTDDLNKIVNFSSGIPRTTKNILQNYYINKSTQTIDQSINKVMIERIK